MRDRTTTGARVADLGVHPPASSHYEAPMSIGTDRLDRMISGVHQRAPCGEAMALPLVSHYAEGYVRCAHVLDARFVNSNGVVFGGYLAALLDDVSSHAAQTVIPDDKVCATAELAISYLRPCLPGDVVLEATVLNQSRRSYHIEVTLRRPDGKLLAKAQAVHALSARTGG
jgi:uncharacterized protein (TIGR00369 family)